MTSHIIGIDISKETLDAHRLPNGANARFPNDTSGHAALVRWISQADARIVYEPTGPYHRALEGALARAGLGLCKVNPRQARRFAQACGTLAKTDKIDAAMLARMGQALNLPTRQAPDPQLTNLRELMRARRGLIRDRVAAKNKAKNLTIALLKQQAKQRLTQIERQLARIDAAIQDIIEQDQDLKQRYGILISIPGIAQAAAFAILIDLPEIGQLDAKKLAALAGLAPRTRQSGKWTGHAFVCGGRKSIRDALYMPALVACRFNPDFKAKYQKLTNAGKPPKVAITAIMRKLIVLANALIRDNRTWCQITP